MNEENDDQFLAVEDGHTFLSRDELDSYREQQVTLNWGSD